MNTLNSVADEIANIRQNYSQVKVQTATSSFLSASYQRTPYTKIKFTLNFPDGYPKKDHHLIVSVTSDSVVPPGLKKKLDKDLSEGLNLMHLEAEDGGKSSIVFNQVEVVVRRLIQFVDNNKFVPCWKELKQCVQLAQQDSSQNENIKTVVKMNETEGKIRLKLKHKAYIYSCLLQIDDNYPTTTHEQWGKPITVQVLSTNFPPKIETILTSQARELVRRMQDGMDSDDALQMSNPMKMPAHLKNDCSNNADGRSIKLTQGTLKGLKKDVDTLSQVRDLRKVNSETVQGDARRKAHSTKERKEARRLIHKITDREIAADALEEQEQERRFKSTTASEKDWKKEEQARLSGYNMHDGSDPQPCLLSLVTFLKNKIQKLPEEKCPVCGTLTLPSDPKKLESLYKSSSTCKTKEQKEKRREAKAIRPIRTYCGCWYHYNCLHRFMTEPPFGDACPTKGCGRRVYHPDWPEDRKQLERSWALQQARKREIEDAAMFL